MVIEIFDDMAEAAGFTVSVQPFDPLLRVFPAQHQVR